MRKICCFGLFLLFSCSIGWSQKLAPFGLQESTITALALTPSDAVIKYQNWLWAGVGNHGVYMRDLDSDTAWSVTGLVGRNISALYIYRWGVGPGDFNTPFAGVESDSTIKDSTRLFQYNIQGKWIASDLGINRKQLSRISALAGIFFSGHMPPQPLFVAGDSSIYRSLNVGGSWEKVYSGASVNVLAVHQTSATVWAGGKTKLGAPWIGRSTDAGLTWETIQPQGNMVNAVLALAIHPTHPDTVYAGLASTVIVTHDGGRTWSYALNGVLVSFTTLALDPGNPAHIYAGGQGLAHPVIFESFDDGVNWYAVPKIAAAFPPYGISTLVADQRQPGAFYLATVGQGIWRYQGRTRLPITIRIPADYATIQAGLEAAANGDSILVAPGAYPENINFLGKNVRLVSIAGPEKTIIDGKKQSSVVTFATSEDSGAWLVGFTLKNGGGTVTPDGRRSGGGIYCLNASPVLVGNVIQENFVLAGCGAVGGGIAVHGHSQPRIENNRINLNIVTSYCDALVNYGGGIYISDDASPVIKGNIITRNNADFGGGIALEGSARALIQMNTIENNLRGGIWIAANATPVIGGAEHRGNDISKNHGSDLGQQLFRAGHGTTIDARYNYFGACPPGEKQVYPTGEFDTENCRMFSVRDYFPLEIGNLWTFGENSLVTDAITDTVITDARLYYRFNRFRGLPDVLVRMAEDRKFYVRIDTTEQVWVDFGARIGDRWPVVLQNMKWNVELISTSDSITVPAGTFTSCYRFHFYFEGMDNDWDEWYAPGIGPVKQILYGFAVINYPLIGAIIHGIPLAVPTRHDNPSPHEFALAQNYPNPFNATTRISYDVPGSGLVTLEIYNLLGQKVRTLVHEPQNIGHYQKIWDGRTEDGKELASGIYTMRLKLEMERGAPIMQIRKLVLLK